MSSPGPWPEPAPALLLPCGGAWVHNQQFWVSGRDGRGETVIGIDLAAPSFTGCACFGTGHSASAGPLAFRPCAPACGSTDPSQSGFNWTQAAAAPIQHGEGQCVALGAPWYRNASALTLVLAPCGAAPAAWNWTFSEVVGSWVIQHVQSGMCMTNAPPAALLSNVFGSGMVLQRGVPAALWGWTDPGTTVVLGLSGTNYTSPPAGSDGRWQAALPAMPATGPGAGGANLTVASGAGGVAVLTDVLFGDVLWCSGQSNMAASTT